MKIQVKTETLSNLEIAKRQLDELINGSLKLNGTSLGDPGEKQARKDIANTLNYFKNKLKHYNEQDSMTFSVDYFAVEVIDRAICNYFKCTQNETPLMQKFKNEVLDA